MKLLEATIKRERLIIDIGAPFGVRAVLHIPYRAPKNPFQFILFTSGFGFNQLIPRLLFYSCAQVPNLSNSIQSIHSENEEAED